MLRASCTLLLLLTPAVALAQTPNRASGNLAIEAREILRKYCSDCHTGSPDVGKSKLNVMDYSQLTETAGRPVPAVKTGGRSQILELIRDGSMPPASRKGPTHAQIEVLAKWIAEKAPAYPPAFNEQYTLQVIADDFANKNKEGKLVRYASFAHLIRDNEKLPDLAAEERQLVSALSLVSPGAAVKIEPIDPSATVYRIELPKAGWGTRDLFKRTDIKGNGDVYPLRPFDLIQMEYPFATKLPASDPLAKRLDSLPFVQGDWLSKSLLRDGKLTPLGEDVKSLVALELSLLNKTKEPEGPPWPRMLGTQPLPPSQPGDRLTPVVPLSAWHTKDTGSAPFALTAKLISVGKEVAEVTVDQEFTIQVDSTSKRSLFVAVLAVRADGELKEQALREGLDRLPAGKTLNLMSDNGPFTITAITTGGDTATEYFVVFASEVDMRLALLKSLHPARPVYRFIPIDAKDETDPNAAPLDPNKVARKVIAVSVTRKK